MNIKRNTIFILEIRKKNRIIIIENFQILMRVVYSRQRVVPPQGVN